MGRAEMHIAARTPQAGIATGSAWRDGHLVPAITGTNCYGADKCAMVQAFLARAGIDRDAAHIRFFSDHASDLPLFALCDEPVAVNPSPRLAAIAAARGWPVLDWRQAKARPP